MRRAGIYVRISRDRPSGNDAGQSGLGVARQLAACREKAESLGWAVAGVYEDNDVSATRPTSRPAYQKLLTDLRTGTVDAVIVWSLDRLHRRPLELERFMQIADLQKVALASVTGEHDLSTESGRLHARIMGNVAAYEVGHQRERLLLKFDQLRSEGRTTSGTRGFGYTPGVRQVIPEQADVIRWMAEQVLAGLSLGEIARQLQARGVRTAHMRPGSPWHRTTVRGILRSPRIVGDLVHRGQVVGRGDWEPILDRSTWEKVQAVLDNPRRRSAAHTNSRKYLLSGFASCGLCGRTVQVHHKTDHNGQRLLGYRCPPPGSHVRVSMPQLDRLVLNRAWATYLAEVIDEQVLRKKQDEILTELEELATREQEASREAALGRIPVSMLTTVATTIGQRRAELEAALAGYAQDESAEDSLRSHVPDLIVSPAECPDLPMDLARQLVRLHIHSVVIDQAGKGTGRFLDRSRVEIKSRFLDGETFTARG